MIPARARRFGANGLKAALCGAALALCLAVVPGLSAAETSPMATAGSERPARGAGAAAEGGVALSFDEALRLGRRAWMAGEVALSNRIARALTEARPDDVPALLMLSASENALGRPKRARAAARHAFAQSESDAARFEASYLVASSAMAESRYTAAQFWLRRAYNSAETDEDRETIARAFGAVRRASPWSVRVSVDVAPSSNVNGGSQSPLLVIDDSPYVGILSGAARALSGYEARLYGRLGYRLSETEQHRTDLTFRGYRSFVTLTDEAKEIAPRAEGSDFEYAFVEAGLRHRVAAPPGPLPDTYGVAVGRTWYGGEALDRFARLSFDRTLRLDRRTALSLGVEREARWSESGRADRYGDEVHARLTHLMESGWRVFAEVSAARIASDDPNQEYESYAVMSGFSMGEPVMGMHLSGHLRFSDRRYDTYSIGFIDVPGGREDSDWTARLDMEIHPLDLMGFVPVVSLNARHSTSNVSRFEGESYGLSVGFSSAF